MTRKTRLTAILAKIEATYGTDAVPTGAANAILVSNPSHELNKQTIDRGVLTAVLGATQQLIGDTFIKISFDVELAGSGTAGTAPALGPLLRACAMAETVTAATSVEYTPVSSGMESLTIYYNADGVLKKALGCVGTWELGLNPGDKPVFKFTFSGLDGGVAVSPSPAQTLTNWKPPVAVNATNTQRLVLGCAYAAAAITGGTPYSGRGLSLTLGNSVQQNTLLGGNSISITDRVTTGSVQLDLSAADEVAQLAAIDSATLTSMGIVHGTAAGNKVLIYAPAVQRLEPKAADYQGNLHMSMSLRLTPTAAGNDELRLVFF